MPEKKTQKVTLTKNKTCKNCIRYGGEGKDATSVASSLYLQNPAYEALGKPDKIVVTISSG